MSIALIGDIHGNLPALDAVLTACQQEGVDRIFCVGDVVGYAGFPNEVIARLQNQDVRTVIGNYDLKVLAFEKKKDKWRRTKKQKKWLAFKWVSESLTKTGRQYLKTLPDTLCIQVGNHSALLCHGSPVAVDECLEPDAASARLDELLRTAAADIIVCGHTHREFMRRVSSGWVLNTGSVGRPVDGDPRACFAVLSVNGGDVCATHHRVPYDTEAVARRIREVGLPKKFARMICEATP